MLWEALAETLLIWVSDVTFSSINMPQYLVTVSRSRAKYLFSEPNQYFFINLFVPNAPFLYPLKTSENRKVLSNLPTICLSVFDHFLGLALKGLNIDFIKSLRKVNKTT